MWTFTETGFTSAVQHRDNPDLLVVRARDLLSLEPIAAEFPELEITSSATSDYPHRIIMPKTKYASWLVKGVVALNYPNFKNRVYQTRGQKFAHLLSNVWATMLGAEDQAAQDVRDGYDAKYGWKD
jgi:hypothetical protein